MINATVDTRALVQKLGDISHLLTSRHLLARIGNDLVEGVIADQFKSGHDPYGNAWRKLSFRQGQPLRDTGMLQKSFEPMVIGDKVVIGTHIAYAPIHQRGMTIKAKPGDAGTNSIGKRYGAKRLKFKSGSRFIYAKKVTIPARPILPDENRGLPMSYRRCIEATVTDAFNKEVRS